MHLPNWWSPNNLNLQISNSKKEKSKSFIDPFLVFCEDNRKKLISNNTTMNSCEITSLLGIMWRTLDPIQKRIYIDIAETYSKYEKFSKILNSKINKNNNNKQKKEEKIENNFINLIPNLFIIPRSNNDINASEASILFYKEMF